MASRIMAYEHIRAHDARHAIYPALRTALAAGGLFAICGFPLVRVALPAALRRHELLWILPVGACAAALELAVLGYAFVPFQVSVGLVLGVNLALGMLVVHRRGRPALPRPLGRTAWPMYAAVLLAAFALLPLYRAGFPTVIGDGSDAHLAAGTAQFLQHNYPTSFTTSEPVNQLPFVWRSKSPIYYALGATAELAGLPTWQALSAMQAVMLAVSLLGFYLLATELLGASPFVALAAMTLVGLDRRVVYTVIHPFYNQMWGFMTMAPALLLAWRAVADRGRERIRGVLALLALFLAVGAFGYTLALPIPALGLLVFARVSRRQRLRDGEDVPPLLPRIRGRSRRHRAVTVLFALVLAAPILGVIQKLQGGFNAVFDPTKSLRPWSGNQTVYYPLHQFLSLDSASTLWVIGPLLFVAVLIALRRAPRPVAAGLLAIFALGAVGAGWFLARSFGQYFEFKLLTSVGPLVVVAAAVGIGAAGEWFGRVGRFAAVAALVALGFSAFRGAHDELGMTTNQLPKSVLAVSRVPQIIGPGQSVRLDMNPPLQIWVGYFLDREPLCSQRPLLDGSYPYVAVSRKANYILVDQFMLRPFDAVGRPIATVGQFTLYRERPTVPGLDRCSRQRGQPFLETGGA